METNKLDCQRKCEMNIKQTFLIGLCLAVYCQAEPSFSFVSGYEDNATAPAPIDSSESTPKPKGHRDITIGPCTWAIGRSCPDPDVKYFIYTRQNPMDRQSLHIESTQEESNLTSSYFNPKNPTKILIHGYNSDMFLSGLQKMREEYLAKGEYNIIYVDWSVLAPAPCYISAVHNTRQAGACAAQLVERLVEAGNKDIHIIGFSLGAQVPNYMAQHLGSFKLPRVTGLDPAMPLFITASARDKLDPSDADFVDVIHTNAMVQGKLERCGHVDFYMNGGITQPGCDKGSQWMNSFACSHQRATEYYTESIRSTKGFWGWACSGYVPFLLGMCPPTNFLLEAGDNIRHSTRGMFLIDTNDTSPYALGKWTDLPTLGIKQRSRPTVSMRPPGYSTDPLMQEIDHFGKLAGTFNNLPSQGHDPYEQWTSYSPTHILDDENVAALQELEVGLTKILDITKEHRLPTSSTEDTGTVDNLSLSLPEVL